MEDFNFDGFDDGFQDDRGIKRQRVSREVKKSTKQVVKPKEEQVEEGSKEPSLENKKDIKKGKNKNPKTKKNKGIIVGVLLGTLVIVGVSGGYITYNKKQMERLRLSQTPVEIDYSTSGKRAYERLLSTLKEYDAYEVDKVVGVEDGDSYLAQEWAYTNNNEVRQKFVRSVCANLEFIYPQEQSVSVTGELLSEMVDSPLNNGESIKVRHIDYKKLSATIEENREEVRQLYLDSGYLPTDYDYKEKMIDLMLDYILTRGNFPLVETELALDIQSGSEPFVVNDMELDKLLFSSEDFHTMCDTFSIIATDYKTSEIVENSEFAEWLELFNEYYVADNGVYTEGVSLWKPVYKTDESGNQELDESGNPILEYHIIKDRNGNDWKQPSGEIEQEIEYEKESIIPYPFLGAYYCQNEYEGTYSPEIKVGDGTLELPAGLHTPVITKCLGTDGVYHDIKVAIKGYWLGQDAIDYAIRFSEKNRGFDENSVVKLITYEVEVENLESEPFTFTSDMFLADRNSNKSTRSGTMYGFTKEITVNAGEKVILNDWATSTELEQKYVCWGSSFERQFPVVFFKLLAGEGEVPTYSAYKQFTGESSSNLEKSDELENESLEENNKIEEENSEISDIKE